MKNIELANGVYVGPDYPCLVIAEIGINHNGSVEVARRIIDSVFNGGCSVVKFQKRDVSVVYTPEDLAKRRQIPPSAGVLQMAVERGVLPDESVQRLQGSEFEDTTNGDLKIALEFTLGEYRVINHHCRHKGVMWFASPWDEGSVDFLEALKVPCYKVASASLTDKALLTRIKETGKPVILSTGMSELWEIERAVKILGQDQLVILHCISTYPCKDNECNLRFLESLQAHFPDVPVGYSGHEKGLIPSLIAVGLGAKVVERHVTLDRRTWGSDHPASMEVQEFCDLIRQIRVAESTLGTDKKFVSPEERAVMVKLRRCYY